MSWGIVYYKARDGSVPAEALLDACPLKVEATILAVLEAVRQAPPPQFSGGGKWEAVHGSMGGYYEIRVTGPARRHPRIHPRFAAMASRSTMRDAYGRAYGDARAQPLNVLDDPRVLHDHLRRIGENIDQDPALTIGAAKELVETICRVILTPFDDEPAKDASLKDRYKAVAERLGLNREAVPGDAPSSQAARNALQAMTNVVGSLAEMRNAMGTGHGKASSSPALARHARMAAHAAQGIGGFLLETWQARRA